MTAFPDPSDFADNAPKPPGKQRDLISATIERIGTLPASWVGFAKRLLFVKADESGPYPIQGADEIDGADALFANMRFGHGCFKATTYTPASGVVALDHLNGGVHLLSLTGNVNANGITIANLPASKPVFHILQIKQDGTGGRTFNAGSIVNAGFSSTDFDFGGINIALPSGANDYVAVVLYWWGSGKVDVAELLTRV